MAYHWWLRTPGAPDPNDYASIWCVSASGDINTMSDFGPNAGVRPAFQIQIG